MQLTYRGNVYEYTPSAPQPYQKPRALNWRYQIPGELYADSPTPRVYCQPKALNWRYQMAMDV